MLATLTTRPALLLRDNSGESGSGGGSGSGIQGFTTTKQKTAPHFPPRPTNERGGGLTLAAAGAVATTAAAAAARG